MEQKISELLYRWGIPALTFLLPFLFFPAPWLSIAQSKIVLLSIATIIFLIVYVRRSLKNGNFAVPRNFLLSAGALLPIVYAISALVSKLHADSIVGDGAEPNTLAVMTLFFVCLFWSASSLSDSPRSLGRMLRAFFAGMFIVLLFQLIRILVPSMLSFEGLLSSGSMSILGNVHDVALLLPLIIVLAFELYHTPVAAKGWKKIMTTSAVLAGTLLVIVNPPDAWIGLFVLLLLSLSMRFKNTEQSRSHLIAIVKKEWLLSIGIMVTAVFIFFGAFIHSLLPSAVRFAQTDVRPSWSGTYIVGKSALDAPAEFLFGSGPNTFVKDWGLYKPLEVNTTSYWNQDFTTGVGTIPTSLVETGLLGLMSWIAFLVMLGMECVRVYTFRGEPTTLYKMHMALIGSSLYLFVFSVLYAPGVAVSALLFIFSGASIAASVLQNGNRVSFELGQSSRKALLSLASLIIVTILILFACFALLRTILSDSYVNRSALLYQTTGDIDRASGFITTAIAIQPTNDLAHRAAVELGLHQLEAVLSGSAVSDQMKASLQQTLTETITHGLTAIEINSADYNNWLMLARVYGDLAGQKVPGAYDSAKNAYQKALETNPKNPLPLLRLAELELVAGTLEAAQKDLARAIEMKSDFAAAYYLDSQIQAKKGSMNTAIQEALKAAELSPGESLGWYNAGAIAYAAGQYESARTSLEKAIAIQSDYANALYVLGLTYSHLGDTEHAAELLSIVHRLNPDDSDVTNLLMQLISPSAIGAASSTSTKTR